MSKKLPLKTALIITTYNQPDVLDFVLETAFRQKVAPNEIIVADDGSGEETELVIRKAAEKTSVPIKHVWQPDEAIAVANSEYIALIDGDCFLGEWFIHDHLRFARYGRFVAGTRVNIRKKLQEKVLLTRDARINLFTRGTSKKFNSIRSFGLATIQSRHLSPKPGKTPEPLVWRLGVASANLAFFRNDAERVNGFNELIPYHGGYDLDFCARLTRSGVRGFKMRHYGANYHFSHEERPNGVIPQNQRLESTSPAYLKSLDDTQTRCIDALGLSRAVTAKRPPVIVHGQYQKFIF